MKRFMVGIMVGLLLGTAIEAFADGYFTARSILQRSRSERMFYVAGIDDTLEALISWGYIQQYSACSRGGLLGEVTDNAERIWHSDGSAYTAVSVYLNRCKDQSP